MSRSSSPSDGRLPLAGLLALASAGFVTLLTEALPTGLLTGMGRDLAVSAAAAGQTITVFALGSVLATLPLTAATRGWPRRRLLLLTIAGFMVVNAVTAASTNFALTLAARFVAGTLAGLVWALLAGYASRMVGPALQGRAIAVAMVGATLALSLGIPAGTFLGQAIGWRWSFGSMALVSLLLMAWIRLALPDFPGQGAEQRLPLLRVLRLPGLATLLLLMLLYLLPHYLLYSYIAPLLEAWGQAGAAAPVLLAFGLAALPGIWACGLHVDRRMEGLILASIAGIALGMVVIAVLGRSPLAMYLGVVLWGFAFGGSGTLFQTAMARAAGEHSDVAQAMLVTVWNLAVALGGLTGALVLAQAGAPALPRSALAMLLAASIWAFYRRYRARARPPCQTEQLP